MIRYSLVLIVVIILLLLQACGGKSRNHEDVSEDTAPVLADSPIPRPLYGVTIDGISPLAEIVQSLGKLSKKPTTRIVFDEFISASEYVNAVNEIHKVSYIMGEILDSYYVQQYSVDQYKLRMQEYLNAFESQVDIWEIGNEVNGEWLGDIPSVVEKITAAYELAKNAGQRTALTLYYNKDCWRYPSEEMFAWAESNIPERMKLGLDYVFVSYYEDDCHNLQPDWPAVFQRLGAMFPNSGIGFGETGTGIASLKEEYIKRYYALNIELPNYVGGYFWWYFRQDMVPYTTDLWQVMDEAVAGMAEEYAKNRQNGGLSSSVSSVASEFQENTLEDIISE